MDHVATLQGFHKLSQTNSNFRKLIHRRDRQSRAIFCLFCNTHIMCARVAHEFDLLPRSPRANSGVVQNSGQFGAISSLGSFAHCTRLALLAALVISHPLPPPSAPPPSASPLPALPPRMLARMATPGCATQAPSLTLTSPPRSTGPPPGSPWLPRPWPARHNSCA